MQRKIKLFKYIGIILIISSILLSIISIFASYSLNSQRINFFENENIFFQKYSVKMRDGVKIYGLLYVDKDLNKINNSSVPTILMLNGINSRKENNFNKAYQLVKLGYAVFSIEQRGHGESGGPSAFLGKEPDDMIEILDYIELNYQFANISHIGLLAFSFGGGVGAILQTRDDRIYTSVLYHPLSSLESILEDIPFQNLIGTTPTILDIEKVQDAYDLAHENNTKNLLLIHGLADVLIVPEDSVEFYNLLNGDNRSDILLKQRPGLDHSGNEADIISFKYSLVWLEHFFHNNSIIISDMGIEMEIESINLLTFNYPNNSIAENLMIISSILLFTGISVMLIRFKILPSWTKLPADNSPYDTREAKEKYQKMIIYRTTLYILPAFFTGLFCFIFNTSLLYGYFIIFPIISIILMLFVPSELHSNWKNEWKKWIKTESRIFFYTIVTMLIPLASFLIIHNLNMLITIKPIIPILNSSLIPYLFIGFSSGILDYIYLREFKPRQVYLILILRPTSLIIFLLFVPVPPFPLLGGIISHVMFILLFGVITLYIRQLVTVLSKFYKNSISFYCLLMCPLIIFFSIVFFRII